MTVFDRDVALKLERAVPNARVMSMADIVAPTLAGPCLDDRLVSVHRTPDGLSAVRAADGRPQIEAIDFPAPGRLARLAAHLGAILRPHELSAKILMAGVTGFTLMLAVDALAAKTTWSWSASVRSVCGYACCCESSDPPWSRSSLTPRPTTWRGPRNTASPS